MSKISIIIPTFNRGNILQETIFSLLSQNYRDDFEIIVIDDGSTDNTQEVIQSVSNTITYIKIDHSGLPSIARNIGLKNATGDYIAFLDSDDVWLPDKLEKQIAILENNPGIGIIASNAYIMRENGEKTIELYQKKQKKILSGYLFSELLKSNFLINSSVIIRRQCLEIVNGFSEDSGLRAVEDYDFWLRLALHFMICYDPEPLLYYRETFSSIRSEQSMIQHWMALFTIYHNLENLILEKTTGPSVDSHYSKDLILKQVKDSERDSMTNLFFGLIESKNSFGLMRYSIKYLKHPAIFLSVVINLLRNFITRIFR